MPSLSSPTPEPEAAPRPARVAALPVRGPIRLPKGRRLFVYAVAAAVWITGAGWLVFHHFVRVQAEFGPMASPLEPWWLRLHGAAAFGALLILGLLWGVHVVNGWRARRRRWSGGLLLGATVVLIVSGYLLYYAGDETLRNAVSLLHWVLGLGAPAAFLWHRFFTRAGP
jgi:hypothetical protein